MALSFDDPSIVFDVAQGVILEASAGSGKTTILTERWLASLFYLLIYKRKTISEALHSIVALTFTEKAATEMRVRIRARIRELWSSPDEMAHFVNSFSDYYPIDFDVSTQISALFSMKNDLEDSISSAVISTINAYVLRLLRCYSSDFSSDLVLSSHIGDNKIIEEEVQNTVFSNLIRGINVPELVLQHFRFGVSLLGITKWIDFFQEIRSLIHKYGEDLILSSFKKSEYTEFSDNLRTIISNDNNYKDLWKFLSSKIQSVLDAMEHENTIKKLTKQNAIFFQNLSKVDPESMLLLFSKSVLGSYQFDPVADPNVNGFRKKSLEQYQIFIDTLYNIVIPMFIPILEFFSCEYHKIQNESRALSFTESEIFLLNTLKVKNFRDKVQSDIDFILLDEYQDTSDTQKGIIDQILATEQITPFFVGDPKQSIYGFRKANVYVFNQTVQEFKKKGYFHKILNKNYRTNDSYLKFINDIFSQIFDQDDANMQYYPQVAHKRGDGSFYFTFSEEETDSKKELQQNFTDAVLIIQDLVQKNVIPGQILILCRNRDTVWQFSEFLKSFCPNIRVASSVKSILWQNEFVQPLISYLNVIARPHNNLMLVELLKTFLFRKTDNEITEKLMQAIHEKTSLFEVMQAELQMISSFVILKDRVSLSDLISLLIDELDYSNILRQISKDTDVTVLLSLFRDEIHQLSNTNNLSLAEFLEQVQAEQHNIEEASIPGFEQDTLQLMTVHAAKGLEADYVLFINKPTKMEKRTYYPLFQSSLLAFDILGKGLLAEKLAISSMKDYISEEKRLAYVALTRAKKSFFFVGLPSLLKNKDQNIEMQSQWASFLNRELICTNSFYAMNYLTFNHNLLKKEDLYQSEKISYQERFFELESKEHEYSYRMLPKNLSISHLLDAEFASDHFYDKYQIRSFDISRQFNNLINMSQPQDKDFQNIGSLVHAVLQKFESQQKERVEPFLSANFPEYEKSFSEIIKFVQNYWNSNLYKEKIQPLFHLEKEFQLQFLLNDGILISATLDLYGRNHQGNSLLLDYKTSVSEKYYSRYERQLSYYQFLLEKIDIPVDELLLFDLKSQKTFCIAYDRLKTEEQFHSMVSKTVNLLQ